jgi:hypothetical protein
MAMSGDFEAAVLRCVAPRLQALGYAYDPARRVDDEMFGFCKALDGDTGAVVQFQRQAAGTYERFTVNVLRERADGVSERAARLSYVLWFVHKAREYPVSDYWWTPADDVEREAALLDAVAQIAEYGVPWIEAAEAPKPWEMPASRAAEFGEAVQAVLTGEMARLGYRLQHHSLAGGVPYCYFSKALPDGTFALIELQAIYSLDPHEFNFDVRLQRRADDDPLAFDGNYGQWRSISLAQLVWQARSSVPLDRLAVPDVQTLLWRYRDRAELAAQLRAALEQIKLSGCAWVEQGIDDTIE